MKFLVAAETCDYDTLVDKLDRIFDDININDQVKIVCSDYKPMDSEISQYAGEKHLDLEIFSPDTGNPKVNTLDDFKTYKAMVDSLEENDKIILIGCGTRIQNIKAIAEMRHHSVLEV